MIPASTERARTPVLPFTDAHVNSRASSSIWPYGFISAAFNRIFMRVLLARPYWNGNRNSSERCSVFVIVLFPS